MVAFAPSPTLAPASSRSSLTPGLCTRLRPQAARASSASRASSVRMVFGKTVAETLESNPVYNGFVTLAKAAGVSLDVSGATVFAPTNAAIANLRPGLVDELLADPAAAAAIVARHILPDAVLTSKQIKGSGFWNSIPGGPLPYEGVGPIVKIAGVRLSDKVDDECDNGTIHTLCGVILDTPLYSPPSVNQYYQPSIPQMDQKDSVALANKPAPMAGYYQKRAVGAASAPSTVSGRKAMGLIKQLPFWQYGPPFNAAKQEDYEPISIAFPEAASVDYQLMPLGSVVVDPVEVSADKLNPISGMSKYIGTSKKMVGDDATNTYSKLD